MQKLPIQHRHVAGFTLLELMIAGAIGSFLIAGVFTVFSNGRQTQGMVEAQTQLIDDSRFAMRTLNYDLRHAGLWGKTNKYSNIGGAKDVTQDQTPVDPMPVMGPIGGDCDVDWYRDLKQSFYVKDNSNPYAASCIPNGEYRLNTDVLVTKYAPPTPVADGDLGTGVVYVYANHFEGALFIGPTPQDYKKGKKDEPENFVLRNRAYFVNEFTYANGDGYPSLHRVELMAGPELTNTMLIPGVEDFQVQLGIDDTGDRSVNRYVDASYSDDNPELKKVISVQYWLMLRSRDKELKGTETQSLSMAGRAPVVYSDGYRRVVVSSVVKLQNRILLNKSAGS